MLLHRCMKCMREYNSGETRCPVCGNVHGHENQPPYALACGTILKGKYLVGMVMGQGGFGLTYVGFDLILNKKVAIKEYYPSSMASRNNMNGMVQWHSTAPKQGCDNFLKEARKMAKLDDIPVVVRVRDISMENATAYIIMDFVEGQTLKTKLEKEGPMSMDQTVELLKPIIEALSMVHKQGIIHRDISPDNIMICPDGKPCLLDLGAAKEIDLRSDGDKQSSQMIHKEGFSPPEQYMTGGKIGPWTDVYALCATIYTCCAGNCVPFVMDRINGARIDFPMSLTSPEISALMKGMSLNPENRFQIMEELWNALQEAHDLKIIWQQKEELKRIQKLEEQRQTEKKRRERIRNRAVAVCIAIIAGIGIGVFAANYRHNSAENKNQTDTQEADNTSEVTPKVTTTPTATATPTATPTPTSTPTPTPTEEPESVFGENPEIGDDVTFGSYADEEIEWQILDIEDGKAFLLSKYVLESIPYNDVKTDITWENCTLRQWLNQDFYESAFNSDEQQYICETTVTAEDNEEYGTDAGNDTIDYIFLLSINEVETYLDSGVDREAVTTSHAEESGASGYTWLLRSPGMETDFVANASGSFIDTVGEAVSLKGTSVRPAMWVSLS